MKIKVHYDFTQQELVGEAEIIEIMLETELHDGDNIEFIYGFCGG